MQIVQHCTVLISGMHCASSNLPFLGTLSLFCLKIHFGSFQSISFMKSRVIYFDHADLVFNT